MLLNFLNPTKFKLLTWFLIGVALFFTNHQSDKIIYCFTTPCNQNPSTLISQTIYSKLTLNGIFSNNDLALQVKNYLQPELSAPTAYFIIDFAASMIVWYLVICMTFWLLKKSGKSSRSRK